MIIKIIYIAFIALLMTACRHNTDSPETPPPPFTFTTAITICTNNPERDSQQIGATIQRIRSDTDFGKPLKKLISKRFNIDYRGIGAGAMLHKSGPFSTPPKAVIVLFPDHDGNAQLDTSQRALITATSDDALVRSAYLLSQKGYRVITLDQPNDYASYASDNDQSSDTTFDEYRTSMKSAVDLSALLDRLNPEPLDTFFIGIGRGSISVLANLPLSDASIYLNPATSGAGSPLNPTRINKAYRTNNNIIIPSYIGWHANDRCQSSTPENSQRLEQLFLNLGISVTGTHFSGGFEDTASEGCAPLSHHGFLGIESCAVDHIVQWIEDTQLQLQATNNSRPVANNFTVSPITEFKPPIVFNLAKHTADADGDKLTYSTPHINTSLEGSISLNSDGTVIYSPSEDLTDSIDTFVYIASDTQGSHDHGLVSIKIRDRKFATPITLD